MSGTFRTIVVTMICLIRSVQVVAQPCGGYEVTAIIQTPVDCGFGFDTTTAVGLNDDGDVVGYYWCSGWEHKEAFVWTAEEGFVTLERPEGVESARAVGINEHPDRQIVGKFDISDVGPRAFFIDGDELILIEPPNNGTFSSVAAINNQRQIVGNTADGSPYSKAYIWEDGVMTIIEPTFGPRSSARDINDDGVVVGWMGTSPGIDSHAFIWNDPVLTDLGLAHNTFSTWARGINNIDEALVRGEFDDREPTDRINGSFLLRKGKFTDLGQLPGYDVIDGFDLNDQSQIVGLARAVNSSNEPDVGFIWQSGVIENLNDLINPNALITIHRALAINNLGQILVRATSQELGEVVAVILTPTEVPLADINGDCEVDVADLHILLNSWGSCSDCSYCPADLNNDCKVSIYDLLLLFSNWG